MNSVRTLAIVLRVTEFSETSCVVTLLTREAGKITGLAKGARRKKSSFESALDLLSVVRLVFLPKAPRAMDLLTEAKLERRFKAGQFCLQRLYRAYYVAELIQRMVEHNDPMPAVYDLMDESLMHLESSADPDLALAWFQLRLLDQLGHRPQFDHCVSCNRPRLGEADRVHFGLIAGGVICPRCRPGHRHVHSVRSETLAAMAQFLDAPWSTIRAEAWTPALRAEASELLGQYLAHLAGHPFRMQSFLKTQAPVAGAPLRTESPIRQGTETDVERAQS